MFSPAKLGSFKKKCCDRALLSAVSIRFLFAIHIAVMIGLTLLMYDSITAFSRQWFISMGLVVLMGEFVFTFMQTGGHGWKWVTPSVLVYAATVVACLYFMEMKVTEFYAEGVTVCTHTPLQAEFAKLKYLTDWIYFCKCGHCNGMMEQLLLVCLMIGRWLLPHGKTDYIYRDQVFDRIMQHVFKSQLILLIACNGADSLDIINYIREPDVKEDSAIVSYIFYVWALSLLQFGVVTTHTKSEKSGEIILTETDMWSSLIVMVIHDIPFLAIRAYVTVKFHLLSATGVFFVAKNLFSILAVIVKTVLLCKMRGDERIQTMLADTHQIAFGEHMEQLQAAAAAEEEADNLRGTSSSRIAMALPDKRPPSTSWAEKRSGPPNSSWGEKRSKPPNSSWGEKRSRSIVSIGEIKGTVDRAPPPPPPEKKIIWEKKPRPPLELRKGPRHFTETFASNTERSAEKKWKPRLGTVKEIKTGLSTMIIKPNPGPDSDSSSDDDDDSDA